MIFESQYHGRSGVGLERGAGHVGLATNALREATYFDGTLDDPVLLREAFAALHEVVVGDLAYRPRDRVEFFAWLEEQDRRFLANLPTKGAAAGARLEELEARLGELDTARRTRLQPFHRARRAYFDFVYQNEYEQYLLLDPVITVHPDELSFEAFSRDESSYARLAVRRELFRDVGDFECGTTNIDFSIRLHEQFERLRTYRRMRFSIAPGGFTVAATEAQEVVREKKIDLPDSWMQGFLQVHATMTMGLEHVRLEPIDLFNVCRRLRRERARTSPRSLRWEFEPGLPPRIVLEPWEHVIPVTSGDVYAGAKPVSIRTWGRDRLQVLARLLPLCQRADVYLAGYGLPSFYVLDLGPVVFTLALSGWTDHDWTGGANFELLTRRVSVSADELVTAYESLRAERFASDAELAERTGLGVETCRSALSFLCQAGRAMVDLASGRFRHRDLLFGPFTRKEAEAALRRSTEESDPTAKAARAIFESGAARFTARRPVSTGYKLSGSVRGTDGKRVRPLLHVDHEGRIVEATCTCQKFKTSKLTKGPCEHMLALRLAHMSKLEEEDG